MNDILKQRLVGALVLIALGVLFWPVIFVETDRNTVDTTPMVEPMPQLAEVEIPPPQPLPDVESVAIADAMREQSRSAAETPAPEEGNSSPTGQPDVDNGSDEVTREPASTPDSPVLDEKGIPVAWVLQVASVSTREKAEKLTQGLIDDGYKAYNRTTRKDGKQLFRVYVGPMFERERLTAAKRDIDKRLDVSAITARYVP